MFPVTFSCLELIVEAELLVSVFLVKFPIFEAKYDLGFWEEVGIVLILAKLFSKQVTLAILFLGLSIVEKPTERKGIIKYNNRKEEKVRNKNQKIGILWRFFPANIIDFILALYFDIFFFLQLKHEFNFNDAPSRPLVK